MAAGKLNRERRALLGAALALPLVPRGVGVEPAPVGSLGPLHRASGGLDPSQTAPGSPLAADRRAGEEWDAALALVRAREAEVRAWEAGSSGLPFAAAEAWQEGYDARCSAMEEALLALLGCPAPDVAALAVKLELAAAYDVATISGGEGVLGALAVEARGLAGVGR
ncbi:MAG TPA: hypothetical protein VGB70_07905 [Allosphingosinicella sp.]|jgi:hypothetical protein